MGRIAGSTYNIRAARTNLARADRKLRSYIGNQGEDLDLRHICRLLLAAHSSVTAELEFLKMQVGLFADQGQT